MSIQNLQILLDKRAEKQLTEEIKEVLRPLSSKCNSSTYFTFEVLPNKIEQLPDKSSKVTLYYSDILNTIQVQLIKKLLPDYKEVLAKKHFEEVEALKQQVAQLNEQLENLSN